MDNENTMVASLKKQVADLTAENEKLKKELAFLAAKHDQMNSALEVLVGKYGALIHETRETV